MRAGAAIDAVLGAVTRYALPPRCPGCGAIQGEDHRFCVACWQALGLARGIACPRCGEPQEALLGGGECGACLADPPRWDAMAAAVGYGPIARSVALRLKHGGRTGLAKTIAAPMARLIGPGDPPLLVPVPLHRWRIWRRGYNQAALIAQALARAGAGEPALDAIRRLKPTPMLRGLGRSRRAAAVRGAFAIAPDWRDRVKGRRIVLVDDVFTTGATAGACTATLKRACVARVEVVTWARVNRDAPAEFDL